MSLKFWLLVCTWYAMAFMGLAQTSGQPNVLFVMLDDQNDYVGFLGGHEQARTPYMDLLAENAHVFEHAYCSSPICAPSRTSMLTGRDPSYTNIYNNGGDYSYFLRFRDIFSPTTGNPVVFTLPEILKDSAGYFTANFYKIFHGWANEGFDNDYDTQQPDPCQRGLSWNVFMDRDGKDEDLKPNPANGEFQEGVPTLANSRLINSRESQTNDYIMVDSAISFLDRYASDPAAYCNRPFFAAVGIYKPHIPWNVVERYYDAYYNRDYDEVPYRVPFNEPNDRWPPTGMAQAGYPQYPDQDYDHLSNLAKEIVDGIAPSWDIIRSVAATNQSQFVLDTALNAAQREEILFRAIWANATMAYMASTTYADAQFGRLWQGLQAHPELAENTIIVLVSDHGYSMGEHHHFHKATLWETDVRVPMVIHDPRRDEPKRIKGVVSLLDVMPTVLDLLGVPHPTMPDGEPYLEGYSLLPMMDDASKELQRPALSGIRYQINSVDQLCTPQFSVREPRYHYIHYQDAVNAGDCDSLAVIRELYEIGPDHGVDPEEWNNLATDSTFELMMDYLAQWLPGGPLFAQATPTVAINTEASFCSLAPADTLRLSMTFRDIWGQEEIPDTTRYGFRWTLHPSGQSLDGLTATFPLAAVDSNESNVTISLQAWPLVDSTWIMADQRRYAFGEAFDPSFQATVEDLTALISDYSLPREVASSTWSYGDGLVRESMCPNAHAYSYPGSYTITRTVRHGSDASCLDTASVTVHLADSMFDSTHCYAPTAAWVRATSSRQVLIGWSPSYHATGYELHYKQTADGLFGGTAKRSTLNDSILLRYLPTSTAFSFTVAARCSSDTSAETYPVAFQTEPCTPPSQFSLAVDSFLTAWTWVPGKGDLVSQKFFLAIDDSIVTNKSFQPQISNNRIYGSPVGSVFSVISNSLCQQLDGSALPGPMSDTVTFVLPWAKRNERAMDVKLNPNPTQRWVNVSWPGEGRWQFVDASGRVLQHGNTLDQQQVLDLQNHPPGLYGLSWMGDGKRAYQNVVITP